MSKEIQSRFGRHIYNALPEVYRTRDTEKHLAGYLDGFGNLMDTIYETLNQRLRDSFPDTCHEWLLPYFAELFGTTLLSPYLEGRRKEITEAIKWRQGKGTLDTCREIVKAVGLFPEVEIVEGWQVVARAAKAGTGDNKPATVNVRKFDSSHLHTHKDKTVRTVDVRMPDWHKGHYNPKTLLLYVPPPEGFFKRKITPNYCHDSSVVCFRVKDVPKTDEDLNNLNDWLVPQECSANEKASDWVDVKITRDANGDLKEITLSKKAGTEAEIRLAEASILPCAICSFIGITLIDPVVVFFRWKGAPPINKSTADDYFESIKCSAEKASDWIDVNINHNQEIVISKKINKSEEVLIFGDKTLCPSKKYRFTGINIYDKLTLSKGCQLTIEKVAAKEIEFTDNETEVKPEETVLNAKDCLFQSINVPSCTVRLEYCTVLGETNALFIQATDSIFAGPIVQSGVKEEGKGFLRFSNYGLLVNNDESINLPSVDKLLETPTFFSSKWGTLGCGVLHPSTSDSIKKGAEDGEEMGAFHHKQYSRAWEAAVQKLVEYLPVGLVPVLVPDKTIIDGMVKSPDSVIPGLTRNP